MGQVVDRQRRHEGIGPATEPPRSGDDPGVEIRLLEIGEDVDDPAEAPRLGRRRAAVGGKRHGLRGVAVDGGGEAAGGVMAAGQPDKELPHLVAAGGAPGRLAGGLDGREEEPHENADDGDDDEELHEREAPACPPGRPGLTLSHEVRHRSTPTGRLKGRVHPLPAPVLGFAGPKTKARLWGGTIAGWARGRRGW